MRRILHHLRRNRTYSHQERWGVFAAMLILTVVVTTGSYLMFGRPVISAALVSIESVNVERDAIPADGITTTRATIRLADKETKAPAAGVWTGLIVANPDLRSSGFTYNGWYSLEPGRAFYQTNENGEVSFQLASTVTGNIEYQIFVANPELKNDNKYQELSTSFWVTFN